MSGRRGPRRGNAPRSAWSWRSPAAEATAGLVATLDEVTGGDWQPWFERYVYGTEVPRLPR